MFLFYPRIYSVLKKNLLCSCSISTFYLSVRTTCYVPVLSSHFTRPLELLVMFLFYISSHFTRPLEQLVMFLFYLHILPVRQNYLLCSCSTYLHILPVRQNNLLCSCSIFTFYPSVRTTCYVPAVLSPHFSRLFTEPITWLHPRENWLFLSLRRSWRGQEKQKKARRASHNIVHHLG